MTGNKSLNAAAVAKQDEFYTQLTDIEKELRHYRKYFAGKTVLCNCDDPFRSSISGEGVVKTRNFSKVYFDAFDDCSHYEPRCLSNLGLDYIE